MAFLVHRWLGIALALLMTLWALSGIVMMYVSFPTTSAEERMAGLEPLDLRGCCASAALPAGQVDSAQVEMIAGRPVLRWSGEQGHGLLDLRTGKELAIGEGEARAIAAGHLQRTFGANPRMTLAPGGLDQWTVYGSFKAAAPLCKASFADERGTVLYVSARNGELVLDTSARERFWNWLGAVPHWLYFTAIRQNGAVWSNIVIYASLLGTFLTLTGIYVGLRMYGRGKRTSPFRGMALWHHWAGLVFGLFTLTWVFSGFASMQPWGWLESPGPGHELAALAGRPVTPADVAALTTALAAHPLPGAVSAELSVQGGKPYAVLTRADGTRWRAALPSLTRAPLSDADLADRARAALPGTPIRSLGLMTGPDGYHYSHHSTPAVLPAYRAIYADAAETRLYLDPFTGELIDFVDGPTRRFRFWHLALHRLDFAPVSARPLWDAIMLPLMAGIALVCGLGVWMGWRRLTRRERARR
jgi:hypothetical protein